jgi:hypothetical protein
VLPPSAVPTFATFYTNAAYRRDAERLGRCCRHFHLPLVSLEGEERGSWKRNCNQKPRLLAQLRRQIAGPIVWLDADCVIHHLPVALLAARQEDALLWQGGVSTKRYVSSQVMWWNDSEAARAMIDDWARRSLAAPESLADPLLKATCEAWRGRAEIGVLPPEYLKPYWMPVEGVTPNRIVISSNERRCEHPDATPRQIRTRLEPLWLPYEV